MQPGAGGYAESVKAFCQYCSTSGGSGTYSGSAAKPGSQTWPRRAAGRACMSAADRAPEPLLKLYAGDARAGLGAGW